MKTVTLKIKYHFDAAHRLEDYKGKCALLHGHKFYVTVFAKGIVKSNGMLVDFTKIKEKINRLDHNTLLSKKDKKLGDFLKKEYEQDVIYFDNPTAEHLAIYLLAKFETIYSEVYFKVRLYETPDASVEVMSDDW